MLFFPVLLLSYFLFNPVPLRHEAIIVCQPMEKVCRKMCFHPMRFNVLGGGKGIHTNMNPKQKGTSFLNSCTLELPDVRKNISIKYLLDLLHHLICFLTLSYVILSSESIRKEEQVKKEMVERSERGF